MKDKDPETKQPVNLVQNHFLDQNNQLNEQKYSTNEEKIKKKRKYANPLKNELKRNEIKNKTIPLSLHHSLHPDRSIQEQELFLKKLNEIVDIFSRLRRETMLYANYVALKSIENPTSFPLSLSEKNLRLFFCYCMDRVMGKKLKKRKSKKLKLDPNIQASWQDVHMQTLNKLDWPRYSNLPNYQKLLQGLLEFKDSIATEMVTMTYNSFFIPFFQRQKNAIVTLYSWKMTWKIIRCINCPLNEQKSLIQSWEQRLETKEKKMKEKPSKKLQTSIQEEKQNLKLFSEDAKTSPLWNFINEHRRIINIEDVNITQTYLKSKENLVVQYYVHLMKMIDIEREKRIQNHLQQPSDLSDDKQKQTRKKPQLRSFSLLPIHSYSRLSLALDPKRFKAFLTWLRKSKEWNRTWTHPENKNIVA